MYFLVFNLKMVGLIFLGLQNLLILRTTYSVIRFLFYWRFFVGHFAASSKIRNIIRHLKKFEIFFQNAEKLRRSTGGTVRTIIVVVRERKSNSFECFCSPVNTCKKCKPRTLWIQLSQFVGKRNESWVRETLWFPKNFSKSYPPWAAMFYSFFYATVTMLRSSSFLGADIFG